MINTSKMLNYTEKDEELCHLIYFRKLKTIMDLSKCNIKVFSQMQTNPKIALNVRTTHVADKFIEQLISFGEHANFVDEKVMLIRELAVVCQCERRFHRPSGQTNPLIWIMSNTLVRYVVDESISSHFISIFGCDHRANCSVYATSKVHLINCKSIV